MAEMKRATAAVTTSRINLITAPADKEVIIFSGTVSNKDETNRVTHLVTIEVNAGGTWRTIARDMPVSYNSSWCLPKIVLQSGDILGVTGSLINVMDIYASFVERPNAT